MFPIMVGHLLFFQIYVVELMSHLKLNGIRFLSRNKLRKCCNIFLTTLYITNIYYSFCLIKTSF